MHPYSKQYVGQGFQIPVLESKSPAQVSRFSRYLYVRGRKLYWALAFQDQNWESLINYSIALHLKVIGVISVRHQIALIGALQLETVGDAAVWFAVLAVAAEVGQTLTVA